MASYWGGISVPQSKSTSTRISFPLDVRNWCAVMIRTDQHSQLFGCLLAVLGCIYVAVIIILFSWYFYCFLTYSFGMPASEPTSLFMSLCTVCVITELTRIPFSGLTFFIYHPSYMIALIYPSTVVVAFVSWICYCISFPPLYLLKSIIMCSPYIWLQRKENTGRNWYKLLLLIKTMNLVEGSAINLKWLCYLSINFSISYFTLSPWKKYVYI